MSKSDDAYPADVFTRPPLRPDKSLRHGLKQDATFSPAATLQFRG